MEKGKIRLCSPPKYHILELSYIARPCRRSPPDCTRDCISCVQTVCLSERHMNIGYAVSRARPVEKNVEALFHGLGRNLTTTYTGMHGNFSPRARKRGSHPSQTISSCSMFFPSRKRQKTCRSGANLRSSACPKRSVLWRRSYVPHSRLVSTRKVLSIKFFSRIKENKIHYQFKNISFSLPANTNTTIPFSPNVLQPMAPAFFQHRTASPCILATTDFILLLCIITIHI